MRDALTWDHLDEVMATEEDDKLYAFCREVGKQFHLDPVTVFANTTIVLDEVKE